jgi:ribonuclease HI
MSTEPIPNRKKPGWTKPSPDIVKINCDGAFTMEQLTGGWGYVMRGCDGAVICTGYGRLDNVLEASHAEIVACLQALQRANEMGIQNVVLETDAMTVVEAIKAQVLDRSSASGLLWELKESLLCNFSISSIAFRPRSCNLVAHSLASLGAKLRLGASPIKDSIPACINVLVANDLMSSSE